MTQDVTFLQKSYGKYTKIEKPVLVTMSYEGLDDEEELKTGPVLNSYNNVNVVTDSDVDDSDDDIKNNNENVF